MLDRVRNRPSRARYLERKRRMEAESQRRGGSTGGRGLRGSGRLFKGEGGEVLRRTLRLARLPAGGNRRSRRQFHLHPQAQRPLRIFHMAILVTPQTKVLIQGITGSFGARHAQLSLDYGSRVVAGVTPGKGGQKFEHDSHKVPVFDTVTQAAREPGATASAILVPPAFAAD